jgi:hypothetical protein
VIFPSNIIKPPSPQETEHRKKEKKEEKEKKRRKEAEVRDHKKCPSI